MKKLLLLITTITFLSCTNINAQIRKDSLAIDSVFNNMRADVQAAVGTYIQDKCPTKFTIQEYRDFLDYISKIFDRVKVYYAKEFEKRKP